MTDDELRSALARRASVALSEDDRRDLLRAARLQAMAPAPQRRLVPRLAGLLVGTAAVIVLALIALPILLSPPPQSTVPTAASAYPNVVVHAESDLAAMANDPSSQGRIVVAIATIDALPSPINLPACRIAEPCLAGTIGQGAQTVEVTSGYRDATEREGVLTPTDDGNRWLTPLTVPRGKSQVSVFRIADAAVEYLGPAQLGAEDSAFEIAQLPVATEKTPTDNVYIVHGWWWSGHWPSCPVPDEAQQTPQPELDFFCQGSWITASKPTQHDMTTSIPDALELPSGNYPASSDQQSPGAAVEGVFAVRSAGCQLVLEPNCPVWRLLGRLDDEPLQIAPSPTATASQPPSSGTGRIDVYTPQQVADKIGDPDWLGKSVLVELPAGAIQHDPCASPLGTPIISCNLANLDVHGPFSTVEVGLRDATAKDGVRYDDGSGYRWVTDLAWPSAAGIYAFRVDTTQLEYLGPARTGAGESPLAVADVMRSTAGPSDDVYVVNGWLTRTYEAPCPDPIQDQQTPRPNSDYYCGGSWLTPESEPSSPDGIIYNDGLHVQNGAYDDFAVNPQPLPPGREPVGYQPRQGVYLVRNAGCPEVVTGVCPVWRMVGRLDGPTSASQAPVTQPTPSAKPPQIRVSNGTTLALDVAINGYSRGTSEAGSIDLFDPDGLSEPWNVTLTTATGRLVLGMAFSRADIGTSAGGTNPDQGVMAGERVDLSCGRLDVSVGGSILGPGVPSGMSFPPGDCDP